ncbi:SGNH hydrolase domain-containing protein, partial [Pseudoxanthomonas putridarboris]
GVVVVVVSILLAHVSKYVIEERFRHARKGESFRPYVIGAGLSAVVLVSASALFITESTGAKANTYAYAPGVGDNGSVSEVTDPMLARNDLADAYSAGCIAPSRGEDVRICRYGRQSGTVVVAIGDSHMVQWLPALSRIADEKGIDLYAMTKTGCAFMSISASEVDTVERKSCAAWNKKSLLLIKEIDPAAVIVANSIGAMHMLGRSHDQAQKVGERMSMAWRDVMSLGDVKLIAIRETPRMKEDPPTCLRRTKLKSEACDTPRAFAISRDSLVEIASRGTRGVSIIDMNDVICRRDVCPAQAGDRYIWRDNHHLTASYVESLREDLSRRIWPLISGNGASK